MLASLATESDMLAQLLRPNAADHEALVEHVGLVLNKRPGGYSAAEVTGRTSDLSSISRSISNAYELWWRSLPWWKAVWLSGSIERRCHTFATYAEGCGLLDKWSRRVGIGITAVQRATTAEP